jgi:thymidine kinase
LFYNNVLAMDFFGYPTPHTPPRWLELILGPMFSGKTTELVRLHKNYTYIGKKVLVINYIGDKRYHESLMSTHDKLMIPCINVNSLADIADTQIAEADVILVNEGQFFTDLVKHVLDYVEKHNKLVYVCGLDGDYRRQKFGFILDLIPYCDKITKLSSFCSLCKNGKKAIFSHRIVTEESQILIGSDIYIPLCRDCYMVQTSNLTTATSD